MISVLPNVPVSVRVRLPCRWPATRQWRHPSHSLGPPGIARAGKSRVELAPDHRLDEIANPIAQAGLDRIKPVVEEINRRLGLRLNGHRASW